MKYNVYDSLVKLTTCEWISKRNQIIKIFRMLEYYPLKERCKSGLTWYFWQREESSGSLAWVRYQSPVKN